MKFTFLPAIQSIKRGTTVMCCVCRMLPGQDQDAGDRVGRGAEQRRAFERSHHAQSRSGPTEPLHRVMLFCRVLSLTCALFAFQVDQLRSELMQERSARHDLEMDKSAIERQVRVNKQKKNGGARFVVLSPDVRVSRTGEGAEVARGRHGGTDETLGRHRRAGKQNSRAGREAAQ